MYPYHVVPNIIAQGKDRETLAAVLSGIAQGTSVMWRAGRGTQHWDSVKATYIQDSFVEKPFGYGDPNIYTGLIITPTADPLVVTVNAASYPKTQTLPPNGSVYGWMGDSVCASVVWGGTTFWMFKGVTIGM